MYITPPHEASSPYSITRLNRTISEVIEEAGSLVWVKGEISSITRHSSGHIYLRLIDQSSQIPAVIWRSYANQFPKEIDKGDEIEVIAQLKVYERGGYYQLDIRKVILSNDGDKLLQLEELKKRLLAEGIFDNEHKKHLPDTIHRVAVITAETGAAFHDIINVISRNSPNIDIILIPATVQGENAPKSLVNALRMANDYGKFDVIIFGRGGGSNEDLFCFNDEQVVRAIFNSTIPIISAVGHEIDTTLSDLVADIRAATPSAAAEIVVTNRIGDKAKFEELKDRFSYLVKRRLEAPFIEYDKTFNRRLFQYVINRLMSYQQYMDKQEIALSKGFTRVIKNKNQQLINSSHQLDNLSPLKLLHKGYSVVYTSDNRQVGTVSELTVGETISVRMSDGDVTSKIIKIETK